MKQLLDTIKLLYANFLAKIRKAKLEWLLIVLFIIGLGAETMFYNIKNHKLAVQITELTLAKQKVDSIKNKRDQTIYTQNAIITNIQSQVKQLAQDKFDLQNKYEKKVKDVEFYYAAKLRQKLPDSVFVPYYVTEIVTLPSDCDSLKVYARDSMISVPKHVTLDKKKYPDVDFDADILKTGLRVNAMVFSDSQFIRVDKMKRSFWEAITFKPNRYEVKVLHTSPYMQVLGQNSIVYVDKKKGKFLLRAVEAAGLILLGSRL